MRVEEGVVAYFSPLLVSVHSKTDKNLLQDS